MPDYKDPGCFCKLCCSPCAVFQAQGESSTHASPSHQLHHKRVALD